MQDLGHTQTAERAFVHFRLKYAWKYMEDVLIIYLDRDVTHPLARLAVLSVLLSVMILFPVDANAQGGIVIASGSETGTYYRIAVCLQFMLQEAPTQTPAVSIKITDGSIENLQLLLAGKAELALIQSDVLAGYVTDQRNSGQPLSVLPLLKLSSEPIHIVIGPSITPGENEVMSIAGHRVVIGAAQSGTAFTARRIIEALSIEGTNLVNAESDQTPVSTLLRKEASAAFFVAEPPDSYVAMLLTQPGYALASFNTSQLQRITSSSDYYVPSSIERYTYSKQPDFVRTIAVDTLLVARSSFDIGSAQRLVTMIIDDLDGRHSRLLETNTNVSLTNVLDLAFTGYAPQHPGAHQAFAQIGWTTWAVVYLSWLIWGGILLLSFFSCVISFHYPFRKRLVYWVINLLPAGSSRQFFRVLMFNNLLWRVIGVLAALLLIWLMGAAGMYYMERGSNVAFVDFQSAGLSILLYLFSSVEGRLPITDSGWLLFFGMLVAGMVVGAYLTGEMASQLLKRTLGGIMTPKGMADKSIVIIGWNDGVNHVITQLKASFEEGFREHPIVVIAKQEIKSSIRQEYHSKGVTILIGDAMDRSFLQSLQVEKSESILLMSEGNETDPDARTALILLELTAYLGEQCCAKPPIVAEVMRPDRVDVIRLAGGSQVEIVTHHQYAYSLLAQATMSHSVVSVYDDLLSFGKDSCEVYVLTSEDNDREGGIPSKLWNENLVGKTFYEANQVLQQQVDNGKAIALLGFHQGDQTLLAPGKDMKLADTDALYVLAWERPCFRQS